MIPSPFFNTYRLIKCKSVIKHSYDAGRIARELSTNYIKNTIFWSTHYNNHTIFAPSRSSIIGKVFSTRANESQTSKISKATTKKIHIKQEVLNIPNALTVGRMVATPYLSYLILNGDYTMALGGFFIAGVSDFLDGYIAKNYNQKTIIGSFLDPMADKFFVSMLSITMAVKGLVPISLVGLMFGRDFGLVLGTLYHRYQTKSERSSFFSTTDHKSFQIEPSALSKMNTALQFSMLGLSLMNAEWLIPGNQIMTILFYTIGFTTVGSGIGYAHQYLGKDSAFRNIIKSSTFSKNSPKK